MTTNNTTLLAPVPDHVPADLVRFLAENVDHRWQMVANPPLIKNAMEAFAALRRFDPEPDLPAGFEFSGVLFMRGTWCWSPSSFMVSMSVFMTSRLWLVWKVI